MVDLVALQWVIWCHYWSIVIIVIREELMLWYSMIRHCVDAKIMCRFPKKVLLVKALMLQQEYYASCLKKNVEPERVQVDARWLRGWLAEYRLTSRRPNRKFKVSRVALSERLQGLLDRNGEAADVDQTYLRVRP